MSAAVIQICADGLPIEHEGGHQEAAEAAMILPIETGPRTPDPVRVEAQPLGRGEQTQRVRVHCGHALKCDLPSAIFAVEQPTAEKQAARTAAQTCRVPHLLR